MSSTIKPSEALKVDPEFFRRRRESGENWVLRVPQPDGTWQEFEGVDWEIVSRFGKIENRVVATSAGELKYDRPIITMRPAAIAVLWGREPKDKGIKVALLTQECCTVPYPGFEGDSFAVVSMPMGFVEEGETGFAATKREVEEETGINEILRCIRPAHPFVNSATSFISNWAELHFIEVDLAKFGETTVAGEEQILGLEFVTIPELLSRIRRGKGAYGVFRDLTALGALMMFFAEFPGVWPR